MKEIKAPEIAKSRQSIEGHVQTAKKAKEMTSQKAFTFGGVLFQHTWLQGVLASASGDAQSRFALDGSTDIIRFPCFGVFFHQDWKVGMSAHAQGGYYVPPSSP